MEEKWAILDQSRPLNCICCLLMYSKTLKLYKTNLVGTVQHEVTSSDIFENQRRIHQETSVDTKYQDQCQHLSGITLGMLYSDWESFVICLLEAVRPTLMKSW